MSMFLGLYLVLIFGLQGNDMNADQPFELAYDFGNPNKVFELPKALEEISGLGLDNSGKYILAIQDEDGVVFFIDNEFGKVDHTLDFWKDGDYEGVELVGDKIFVVKSSGTIYEIEHYGTSKQKVEKYNFFLNEDNDVEGLAYHPKRHSLLLACKAKAGTGAKYKLKKGIYEFDLTTKELSTEPFLLISLEAVNDYLDTSPIIRKIEKVVEFFQPTNSTFSFSPSGIAVHPITGHYYMTSAVGKLLLVADDQGKVLHIENLKKSIHAQPEGICFDSDGNLYIANEGKGGQKPVIFKYLNQK